MDEEANSWIRRTKFSHTVCHRLDPLILTPIPLSIEAEENARLKSWPLAATGRKPVSRVSQVQRKPIPTKQRSLSPLPQTSLSEAFREARDNQKRFSTPMPQRKVPDKAFLSHRESREPKTLKSVPSFNNSSLRHLASKKTRDKLKASTESAWTKYFDHGGGRVVAVETEDWAVDMSKLFLGHRFAHGAHSRLYHGIYMDEPVAVKIIRVPDDDENGSLAARLDKQFTREASLLSQLHHSNVIKFVAACKKPPVYCIITEYLSEGSLRAYLHKLERRSIPLQKLLAIALDVARGMDYVHSQGVIHRDLKPENVIIDENFHLKIADFGIACDVTHCDTLADDPGTFRWMAPEMMKRKPYGRKVDVYSFGLILWEMMAGTIPFEELNPVQVAYAVLNKGLRPEIPKDCPPSLQALIEQCWSLHPHKRPDFWQIVKVLEEFEFSYALDGTLNNVHIPALPNHKKGLHRWIKKLAPVNHQNNSPSVPKPKFA
ncbi:hypothetical protein SAY87_006282 [Trapa incisa]|uniref:Protein kinase domain-containing protein n=1 Tax=Trapa incisa TaxID=236973 RepID=A0AAN7Q3L1_9MYRT|nr:hypothetical protein SAY87_006282 [Trapa incisa]